jgi:hypothetical protein
VSIRVCASPSPCDSVIELAGDVLPACGGEDPYQFFVGLQVRFPLLRAISDVGFVGFFF